METERMRGNPAGITNTHVAANIRAARQAIGMDLRTLSDRIGETGRKLSPSGISKLESGDRRVDVDDLTVIAYILRTTPAALLTPPDAATTLTGVPDGYLPEEVEKWMRGELVLTDEGLLHYWQQEWAGCLNRSRFLEDTLGRMNAENSGAAPATIDVYIRQLAEVRARERVVRERGIQVDPTGRVFKAADYLGRFTD